MALKDWSTTAADNNSSSPNGFPEGMAPSGVNDAAREMMAQVRGWYEDPAWINYGYTYTYVGGTQFKISGQNVTSKFVVGRRVRAVGSSTGTIYGTITASAFSTDTTVTVSWDSGTLSNETLQVSIAFPALGRPITGLNISMPEDTIASATTTDLGSKSSNILSITGTTTITGLGSSASTAFPLYFVRFTGALTLTHNATSLILPGAANITTATGDTATFKYEGSGNWRCMSYNKASGYAVAVASVSVPPSFAGRLTLTSATPVTTSDVTGATTIYFALYKGNSIPIYDGSAFVQTTFTELSNDTTASSTGKAGAAAVAANKVYDLFVWNDSGTIRLTRGPLWDSDTSRGTGAGKTELELVNGVWVNKQNLTNGPNAQRGTYVGTVRSDGSSQINDSAAKRHVWNTYNRVIRSMINAAEKTDNWTYNTASYRQANSNTANQLDYVVGLAEDAVTASLISLAKNSAGNNYYGGIGVDSTTENSAQTIGQGGGAGFSGAVFTMLSIYKGIAGIGRHYLAWLEHGSGSGTQTWYGDNGTTAVQSGLSGELMA